ncbi:hypothetical protein J8655_10005 [Dickeya oryzae]|uniref:hypothetical protein n=1 Tax=Dickeya oryzae TaxID=1240404 RepID=UPI001AEC8276|nr:hypothetical protein [Dickeya oryzae]MBP2845811.1 hypothetical protein [Dickeya oryzae]
MQKPKYNAYVLHEYVAQNGENKTFWTKIGAAFENKNGGLNISITPGVSVSGKIVLLEPKEKDDSGNPISWKD